MFITENDLAELFLFKGDYVLADEMISNCLNNYETMSLDPQHYKVFDIARKISSAMQKYDLANENANRYVSESEKFIHQQEELIQIRDQFKMEILTASFFGELERNERISDLKTGLICLFIISVIIIGYLRIRQTWIKSVLTKELGKLARP